MNTLTHAELKRLAGLERRAVVSCYVPRHQPRSHEAIGPTTLKNLRNTAEQRLIEHGWRDTEARDLLKPLDALIVDEKFWSTPHVGLAIFVGPDLWDLRSLHAAPAPLVWVGKHPYLKPLWGEMAISSDHFVLSVNQHGAQLYRGDRFGLEPVSVAHLPAGIRVALGEQQHERGGQFHSGHSELPGKEGLVFHGQGGSADAHRSELIHYLREVDRAVHAAIGQSSAPVVFVGVELLFGLYREITSIAHLWPNAVHGNSEHWSLVEIRNRVLTVLQPYFAELLRHDLARFEAGRHGDRVSANLEEIVRGASAGQIEAVFVASETHIWGEYDLKTGAVTVVEQPHATNEDLLDRIASQTFINGGRVHVLPMAEIPGGLVTAALLRYPRLKSATT